MNKYIIKIKVGRNIHISEVEADMVDYTKKIYMDMKKCTYLAIYELKEEIKNETE